MWLPVTPKPTTIEVGAKAKGARGISEELERVLSGSKNMATPFREGRKLSHHMTSALAKALRLMLIPDSGRQVDQVAEEEPHCWRHLGKGELTNEREQFPLDGLVLG